MRRQHGVRGDGGQGVRLRRLVAVHVDAGAEDRPARKQFPECRIVDDLGAGGVHQDGVIPHALQQGAGDHAVGLGAVCQVQRDDVAAGEQLVEVDTVRAQARVPVGVDRAGPVHDVHPDSL